MPILNDIILIWFQDEEHSISITIMLIKKKKIARKDLIFFLNDNIVLSIFVNLFMM